MAYSQEYMTLLDDSSSPTAPSNISQSNISPNQADFQVYCLSQKRTLTCNKYASVDDIKNNAFKLYADMAFNDDNAILTHVNNNEVEDLLITASDLFEKNHSKDLFIRFVHPVCIICSNPFGIIDNQLPLQCPRVKCGAQYCSICVQAAQGPPPKNLVLCINCKKEVTPKPNLLIQKNIMWKSMWKLYGIQSFLDLKGNTKLSSCYPILKNIKFRVNPLECAIRTLNYRLDPSKNRMKNQYPNSLSGEQLIKDAKNLCAELKQLTERIKQTNQEIQQRNITVKKNLTEYKDSIKKIDHLCNTSTIAMIKSQTVNNNITTNITDIHQEHIKSYNINDLGKLPFEENKKLINDILQDLINDRKHLLSCWMMITSLLKDEYDKAKLLEYNLGQIEDTLTIIFDVEQELNDLLESQQTIDGYIDEYYELLQDDQHPEILYSKFILLLEKMRILSEELEILQIFPETIELKEQWQHDHGRDNNFKPKVLKLFETIETELKKLLSDENWIYSVPYKIGVIGATSTGKSSLTTDLADLHDFPLMTAVERNTFGYLPFDTSIYKDPRNNNVIPITFVDVEGATDTNKHQSNKNYIELINKADCDLYIIVFDNLVNEHNRACLNHIEKKLQRKCLLVRNKADVLFNSLFQEATNEKYTEEHSENFMVDHVLVETRGQAQKTFDDDRLDNEVYLTAAVCDNNLKGASFATFDLVKLKKKFVDLAITESRARRICDLAISTSITVINTCFRRGYTISKTMYKLLAASGGLVPFLDELPTWLGREKIRQAFGIHDNSALGNSLHGTQDSFEKYLTEKKITVPKNYLKSNQFRYLIAKTTKQTMTTSDTRPDMCIQQQSMSTIESKRYVSQNAQIWIHHTSQAISKPVVTALIIISSLADDTARLIIPTTTGALRAISIASIVASAFTTPIFAAWSAHCTGKRMIKELDLLCDDLVVILQYFIGHECGMTVCSSSDND